MFFLTVQFRNLHKLQTHNAQTFRPSDANRLPTHLNIQQVVMLMLPRLLVEATNKLNGKVVYSVFM